MSDILLKINLKKMLFLSTKIYLTTNKNIYKKVRNINFVVVGVEMVYLYKKMKA